MTISQAAKNMQSDTLEKLVLEYAAELNRTSIIIANPMLADAMVHESAATKALQDAIEATKAVARAFGRGAIRH